MSAFKQAIDAKNFGAAAALGKFQTPVSTANEKPVEMSRTENGALTLASTANRCLDFFNLVGASRQNPAQAVRAFEVAFLEHPILACQIALWSRDCRGGAGERNVFKEILLKMESNPIYKPYLDKVIPYVPEIGRFDDLLNFTTSDYKEAAYNVFKSAIWAGNGLAAKWLPRKGALVPEIRRAFELSPRNYRKLVVGLTKVVEQKMCAQQWNQIIYDHVPSIAAGRYQKAFGRHDPDGYTKYREGLKKAPGEVGARTIHASVSFPYDVLRGLENGIEDVAEAQWNALPNYMGEQPRNVLAVVDVSGSMSSQVSPGLSALQVAVSVGLYCATKNEGRLKDTLFTFSRVPEAINLVGTLKNKVRQIRADGRMENTDIQACFRELLKIAVANQIPEHEMPEYVLLVSDMEFDQATSGGLAESLARHRNGVEKTNYEAITQQYINVGYTLPKIVFWNVMSRSEKNAAVKFDQGNTALVSGFSPAIMKSVLGAKLTTFNPLNVMLDAVDIDRYRIFDQV